MSEHYGALAEKILEALGEMFRNQVRNLEERRISIHQAVFERP